MHWMDRKLDSGVNTAPPVGFPEDMAGMTPDTRAALLGIYAGQYGSYTNLLWQVPALSLTAQAFLFAIVFSRDASLGARAASGLLSTLASLMSIYLMISHRIRAARYGQVAEDLARQLGAARGNPEQHRGAAGVWSGVNRGSFAFWIAGLGIFGFVGLTAAAISLVSLLRR